MIPISQSLKSRVTGAGSVVLLGLSPALRRWQDVRGHQACAQRQLTRGIACMRASRCRIPGLLASVSAVLCDLALDVGKADTTNTDTTHFASKFYVTNASGGKVTDPQLVKEVATALEVLLKAKSSHSAQSRPKFDSTEVEKTTRMQTLMGELRRWVAAAQQQVLLHQDPGQTGKGQG